MPHRSLRTAPRAALTALGLLVLGASSGFAWGYCGTTGYRSMGYGFTPGFRTYTPAAAYWGYDTYWPAYSYMDEGLTDEDLYAGSKQKGDRMMGRGQFSGATREYRNAFRRASRAWGADSKQANTAKALLAKAQESFQKYGDARPGKDYGRAKRKGDRAFDRGDYARAIAQYEDALKRAHTDEQAQEAVGLLVRAKAARDGRPALAAGAPAVPSQDAVQRLKQAGDLAMARGDFRSAVASYASALTRSIKLHGADSASTRTITQALTRAQEHLAGGGARPARYAAHGVAE